MAYELLHAGTEDVWHSRALHSHCWCPCSYRFMGWCRRLRCCLMARLDMHGRLLSSDSVFLLSEGAHNVDHSTDLCWTVAGLLDGIQPAMQCSRFAAEGFRLFLQAYSRARTITGKPSAAHLESMLAMQKAACAPCMVLSIWLDSMAWHLSPFFACLLQLQKLLPRFLLAFRMHDQVIKLEQ